LKLAKCASNSVLAVLLNLEIAIHKERTNQVVLTNGLLKQYGIKRQAKIRGLQQLAAAGVIFRRLAQSRSAQSDPQLVYLGRKITRESSN
jgi:hypothetical protein